MTDDALKQVFAEIGPVTRAEVVRDRSSGDSRGFGFVEMANPEDLRRAVKQLHGKELMGRRMRVETATTWRKYPAWPLEPGS